jgi:hypothetical protein
LDISEKSLVNDVADTDAEPELEPDDDDVVVDDELLLEQAAASSPPTSIIATRARLLWIPMTTPPNLVSALYTALAGMSRPFRTLQQNEHFVNDQCSNFAVGGTIGEQDEGTGSPIPITVTPPGSVPDLLGEGEWGEGSRGRCLA